MVEQLKKMKSLLRVSNCISNSLSKISAINSQCLQANSSESTDRSLGLEYILELQFWIEQILLSLNSPKGKDLGSEDQCTFTAKIQYKPEMM